VRDCLINFTEKISKLHSVNAIWNINGGEKCDSSELKIGIIQFMNLYEEDKLCKVNRRAFILIKSM